MLLPTPKDKHDGKKSCHIFSRLLTSNKFHIWHTCTENWAKSVCKEKPTIFFSLLKKDLKSNSLLCVELEKYQLYVNCKFEL